MSEHFDLICREHNRRVGGCRCASPSKSQRLIDCPGGDACGPEVASPERRDGERRVRDHVNRKHHEAPHKSFQRSGTDRREAMNDTTDTSAWIDGDDLRDLTSPYQSVPVFAANDVGRVPLYTIGAIAGMLEAEGRRLRSVDTTGANEHYANQERARELESVARYLRQRRAEP